MLITFNSETHPQARIEYLNLRDKKIEFVWIGGPHQGAANLPYNFSVLTATPESLAQAIGEHIGAEVTGISDSYADAAVE